MNQRTSVAKRILFVCTGNSCRSVMAQGLLQARLKQMEHLLREPVEVKSAGVFAIEGMPASRETLRLLQQAGVDASGHMARRVTEMLATHSDLIFVMEPAHREELIRRVPSAANKVHLLGAFGLSEQVPEELAAITDPMGKPGEVYEVCFARIREAIERVAQALTAPAR